MPAGALGHGHGHRLAKWCLVTAAREGGVADGTCCPREGEAKGGGHEKMHFVTLNFAEGYFGAFRTMAILMPGGIGFILLYVTYIHILKDLSCRRSMGQFCNIKCQSKK